MQLRRTGDDEITATFTYAEAFVLFDVLHRWEVENVAPPSGFQDKAEQLVLWDLSASLEPMMDAAFSNDYLTALHSARAEVRGDGRGGRMP